MICKNCGSEIRDGVRFCNFCGAPVDEPRQAQPEYRDDYGAYNARPVQRSAPQKQVGQPKKSKAPMVILIVLLCVLLVLGGLGVGGYFLIKNLFFGKGNTSASKKASDFDSAYSAYLDKLKREKNRFAAADEKHNAIAFSDLNGDEIPEMIYPRYNGTRYEYVIDTAVDGTSREIFCNDDPTASDFAIFKAYYDRAFVLTISDNDEIRGVHIDEIIYNENGCRREGRLYRDSASQKYFVDDKETDEQTCLAKEKELLDNADGVVMWEESERLEDYFENVSKPQTVSYDEAIDFLSEQIGDENVPENEYGESGGAQAEIEDEPAQPEPETEAPKDDASEIFSQMGRDYLFSSGVGAWGTTLHVDEDGSFKAEFGDFNGSMGEDKGPGYYRGVLTGKLVNPRKISDYEYQVDVADAKLEHEPGEQEYIEVAGQKMYVEYTECNGFPSDTKTLTIYTPDAPVSELDESFISWVRLRWFGKEPETLGFYGIDIISGDTHNGFVQTI